MIYRLLLDQALTVRSTPVLSFAPPLGGSGQRKRRTKNTDNCLLTDKSSFVY